MNANSKQNIQIAAEICFKWSWDARKYKKVFEKLVAILNKKYKVKSEVNSSQSNFDIFLINNNKKVKLYSLELEDKLLDEAGIDNIVKLIDSSFA